MRLHETSHLSSDADCCESSVESRQARGCLPALGALSSRWSLFCIRVPMTTVAEVGEECAAWPEITLCLCSPLWNADQSPQMGLRWFVRAEQNAPFCKAAWFPYSVAHDGRGIHGLFLEEEWKERLLLQTASSALNCVWPKNARRSLTAWVFPVPVVCPRGLWTSSVQGHRNLIFYILNGIVLSKP